MLVSLFFFHFYLVRRAPFHHSQLTLKLAQKERKKSQLLVAQSLSHWINGGSRLATLRYNPTVATLKSRPLPLPPSPSTPHALRLHSNLSAAWTELGLCPLYADAIFLGLI